MFFSISKTKLENFPCAYRIGDFVINTDNGWQHVDIGNTSIVYKGYIDNFDINRHVVDIVDQAYPVYTGNFCAIVSANGQIQIKTDRYRGFPIYISDNSITNLIPSSYTAWTDSLVTIHPDFTTTETKFDVIGNIDTSPMSAENVLDEITKILDQKTKSFIEHNALPVRVFLSGGIDSMLVYSFLKKYTNNYELVNCSHIDYDYFWLKNSGHISEFWGYNQIHHWRDPCVLTSGTPGDEFMLRSPTTSDMWLKAHGIKITELLNDPAWRSCLHAEYFNKHSNYSIFQQQLPVPATPWDLCNIIVNDWQHWHLGNTLTWTPLRDLEIFKLMLRLPLTDAIGQIMDSSLSKKLIDQNVPGLSKHLSDIKNSGNTLSNLIGVID